MCPCLKFILVYVLSVGKVAKVAKVAGFMYGGEGTRWFHVSVYGESEPCAY